MSADTEQYLKNLVLLEPFLSANLQESLKQNSQSAFQHAYNEDSDKFTLYFEGKNFAEHFQSSKKTEPLRIQYHDNIVENLLEKGKLLQTEADAAIMALCNEVQPPKQSFQNNITPGFGICFGLGDGSFLKDFVTSYSFRDLIICENYLDFLISAMQITDWQPIINAINKREGKIHFIIQEDAELLNYKLNHLLRSTHPALLEGSYIHNEHLFGTIPNSLSIFLSNCDQLIQHNGWIDDEITHTDNIVRNLNEYPEASLIDQAFSFKFDKPVLIIGSGPSLGENIEFLKSNRASVLIVSCGTALRVLLNSGIHPDFHIELENGPQTTQIVSQLAAEFDLSKTMLIASCTTHFKLSQLFSKTLYFPREGEAYSSSFLGSAVPIPGTGRTGTLSAISIFLYWQAPCLILLGIDLAQSADGLTHSANTIYQLEPKKYGKGSGQTGKYLPVEGNFTTEVLSSPLWVFMRLGIEQSILFYSNQAGTNPTKIYNASNGAKIKYTIPCPLKNIPELQNDTDRASNTNYSELIYNFYQTSPLSSVDYQASLVDFRDALQSYASDFYNLWSKIQTQDDPIKKFELFYNELILKTSGQNPENSSDAQKRLHETLHSFVTQLTQFIYYKSQRMPAEEIEEWMQFYLSHFWHFIEFGLAELNAHVSKNLNNLNYNTSDLDAQLKEMALVPTVYDLWQSFMTSPDKITHDQFWRPDIHWLWARYLGDKILTILERYQAGYPLICYEEDDIAYAVKLRQFLDLIALYANLRHLRT